jgi:4-diphosphocytidyl-2-C-methyl-D-erythritol kinase
LKDTALAYAKINISLDIVSKMSDGYHNLRTVMQTVGLADEITIECKPGEGISIEAGRPYLPGDERNIAAKAANVFYDHTGIKGNHTHIRVKKNIPVCAGLGGGSTDGACVLRMLDHMYKTGLGCETLEILGNTIGSDVPFSIEGGTKLAEGRGDILTNLPPMPHCHVVICKPPFSCSTPELFGLVKCEKIRARPDTEGILKALEEGNIGAVARRMYNVFEDILPRGKQEITEIKSIMLDNNALGSIMTGSGPTVFGLYEEKTDAQNAFNRLKVNYRDSFLTHIKKPNHELPKAKSGAYRM